MKTIKVGFIPLIDAAIPIAAVECGFAEREGIQIELVRETSWANIRDKLIHDLFDASHMLAPLAVTTSTPDHNEPAANPCRLRPSADTSRRRAKSLSRRTVVKLNNSVSAHRSA